MATAAAFEAKVLSVRSLKGHFTRRTKSVQAAIDAAGAAEVTNFVLNQLKQQATALEEQFDKVAEGYSELMIMDPTQADDYERRINTLSNEKDLLMRDLLRRTATVEKALTPTLNAAAAASARVKPVDSLKPRIITKDSTPMELAIWIDKFETYFEASRLEHSPSNKEKQGHFLACIDNYLYARLQTKITPATPIFPDPLGMEDSCVELLQREFLVQHPIFVRRLDYYRFAQSTGQKFTDWSQKLLKMEHEANLQEMTEDELRCMRYITGCTDQDLLKEFMKEANPTVQRLDEIAVTHERNKKYEKAMGKSYANATKPATQVKQPNQQKVQRGKQRVNVNATTSAAPNSRPTTKKARFPSYVMPLVEAGKCVKCGNKRDDSHVCRATEHKCKNCQKVGHFPSVCWEKLKAAADGNPSKANATRRNPQQAFDDYEDDQVAVNMARS